MKDFIYSFFGPAPVDAPFVMFGTAHIISLLMILILILTLLFFKNNIKNYSHEKSVRILLGVFMILCQNAYFLNNWYNGIASLQRDLPLSLCGATMILSGIMMITNSYKIFEVIYFWSICGVVQAMFTPNLGPYGPTHFRFYQYMAGHIGIIVVVFYMIFINGYRPTFKSLWQSGRWILTLAAFVLVVNLIVNANYMFLMGPTVAPSVLDLLPQFPLNIVVLIIIAAILFLIAYSPFYIIEKIEKKNNNIAINKMTNA